MSKRVITALTSITAVPLLLVLFLVIGPPSESSGQGPGKGPFGPPRPGQVLPGFFQDELKLTARQKKDLEEIQKEVDNRLAKVLTADQKKALEEGRFFFPKGGPGGKGGPGKMGGKGGPPAVGQILPTFIQDRLELSAEQKKEIAALQKDVDTRMAKLLTAEQKKSLQEVRDRFARFPGPGGFGPMGQVRKLVKQFDKNGDGWLNKEERKAARELVKKGGGKGGFMGKGPKGFGMGFGKEPPKAGPKLKPDEVATYPKASLYEPTVFRTLFLEFEDKDWEAEMSDFYKTDVEVPATLTVDGKRYPNVGVRFRGMSSYFRVSPGWKKSMNVSVDLVDKKQRVLGYKTLNLLNGADDPSFLSTVLYSQISRNYIPAPRANLVRVVINGESWGVYVNVQQFNKEFTEEFFKGKGARWKVPGGPGGAGGLEYIGENIADYKRRFAIKSKDDDRSWKALINLCKVLNQTPPEKLEAALKPILDIDGALWFLAIDNALINNDGYWVRASDYSIFLDKKGKFHMIAHDMNEAFQPAMGFGFGGKGGKGGPGKGGGKGGFPGMGGQGVSLDPLIGLTDSRKPLRSKLLAVPALRERYLRFVKTIAEEQLDWMKLGPTVAGYKKLIEKEVATDTRKLYTLDAFKAAVSDMAVTEPRGRQLSLRSFADQRRKYLLNHPEIKKLGSPPAAKKD